MTETYHIPEGKQNSEDFREMNMPDDISNRKPGSRSPRKADHQHVIAGFDLDVNSRTRRLSNLQPHITSYTSGIITENEPYERS
jgi:hypothetical protein